MPKCTNNFGQRKPRPPDPWGNPANHLAGLKNPYGNSANHLADLKNPYGSSANHLASLKIRMAAPPTTWRAQKSVWQLRQPLGGPKNPYGSSASLSRV